MNAQRHRRIFARGAGFTLLEIVIVSALIALLSAIAIFGIQQMYDSNLRKITIGESAQLATALSIAEQDVQFYPKLHHLADPKTRMLLNVGGGGYGQSQVIPFPDYMGFIPGGTGLLTRMQQNWSGPYMGMSSARVGSNRGRGGIVQVRLSDVTPQTIDGDDISVVPWPADPYGQPYVVYQLRAALFGATQVAEFTEIETEIPDLLNAVVSYGRNGFPGGNEFTSPLFADATLIPGALFVVGDLIGTGAAFTMKSAAATNPDLRLVNGGAQQITIQESLRPGRGLSVEPTQAQIDAGEVGVIDRTSDDIIKPIG